MLRKQLKFNEIFKIQRNLQNLTRSLKFNEIYSIDVAPARSVKEAYLGKIDLDKLGLSI